MTSARASAVVLAFVALGCSGSSDAHPVGADGGCPRGGAAEPGVVVTDRGAVRGSLVSTTYAYKNVPYAAPPVGDLRWVEPQPAACWDGVRDGTAWGPSCPQSDATGTAPVTGDEDCLQLNVWTPADVGPSPLPVLFWIHGGGFTGGSATETAGGVDLYDGQRLAEKTHAVVVTVNYRLGVLGFLAHPALAAEATGQGTGNYGMLDQIAALKWVRRNAAAFGGDPSHVMIFGESAGGASVCLLVASPLAQGLFSSAIMESGGCKGIALSDAEAFGSRVAQAAQCDTATDTPACLRGIAADAMVNALPVAIQVAGPTSAYGGVIDGSFLVEAPIVTLGKGGHSHVPMIVGSNSDETSRTVPLARTATDADYQAAVRLLFPTVADLVLAQYPSSSFASPWAAYVAVTTDAKFTCSARRAIQALRQGQSEPVFRYFFTHALDNAPASKPLGAWHGSDIPFVFDHLDIAGYTPSAGEQALSNTFGAYWSRLAAAGDPNGGSELAWPPSDANDTTMQLDEPSSVQAGVRTAQCDFWAGLGL